MHWRCSRERKEIERRTSLFDIQDSNWELKTLCVVAGMNTETITVDRRLQHHMNEKQSRVGWNWELTYSTARMSQYVTCHGSSVDGDNKLCRVHHYLYHLFTGAV